jgi:hypothetical protein
MVKPAGVLQADVAGIMDRDDRTILVLLAYLFQGAYFDHG